MNWLEILRAEAKRTSINRTAQRLGVSSTMISQALAGKYPHTTNNLEQRVRGELMEARHDCPVLGDISARQCADEQRRPFAPTNPVRVALFRACRDCAHYSGRSES